MYFKGMSARRIEKLTDIHHTTISSWIRDLDASNLVVFKENEFDRIDRPMYARL
jgi:transposase